MTGIAAPPAPTPAPMPGASAAPASAAVVAPGGGNAAGTKDTTGAGASFDDLLAGGDAAAAAGLSGGLPAADTGTIAETALPPAADARPVPEPAPSAALPEQLLAMFGALSPMPAVSEVAAPVAVPPTAEAGPGAAVAGRPLGAQPGTTNPLPTASAWTAGLATAGPATAIATAATTATAMAGAGAMKPDFAASMRDAAGPAAASMPDAGTLGSVLATAPAAPSAPGPMVAAAVTVPGALALPADPDMGFDDGFGSRIVWMAEQRLGHADIRITPEHLGTIDVRLQLDGTKVSAEFFSAQPEVRQALEASFTRLRDMLGQQGLELAQADVGQQRRDPQQATPEPGTAERDDRHDASPAAIVVRSRRLLDEVA